MPADDLVLNVRQIAGYPPLVGNVPPQGALLIQTGGLGSAYASVGPAALVGTALALGGDMAIGGQLLVQSVQGGAAQFSNGAFGVLGAQKACFDNLTATFGCIGGSRIATAADLAALAAASVTSFNGRQGAVCLWLQDIVAAGGAPNFSPVFGGEPRAPTPAPTSNSTRLATTAYVTGALGSLTLDFAPLDSPNFTGVPTAPTPVVGSADGTLATTAFVQSAIANSTAGVASFNTRTGIVTLTNTDVTDAGGAVLNSPAFTGTPTAPTPPPGDSSTRIATTAFVLTESGFAPLASPAFTGIPTAPTPTPGTNTTQIATTAYVQAAITGISLGVTTFNGRSGAVTLVANDITAAGGAILASPAFTGTPTAPNPPPGDSSTRIATTAYVQSLAGFAPLASPAFTGVPTAPTAAPGNNTQQIATTAFVEAAIANSTTGVASFNGRTGAVTLQANDISAAGGAVLASPAFTGTPSAPTAALGTSSTQLATTAYVMNAASTTLPLAAGTAAIGIGTTWARSDHVHPTDPAIPAASSTTPLMDGAAAVGTGTTWARADHRHPSDTTRLALTGGTLTGGLGGTTAGFAGSMTCASYTINATNGAANWAMTSAASMTIQNNNIPSNIQLDNGGNFVFNGPGSAVKAGGGPWVAPSDARIKTELGDYDLGLSEVLALRPIVFEYKGNDGDPAAIPAGSLAEGARRFVGFIAQELEQIFPAMVTRRAGFIDGKAVDDFRYADIGELTYALVNAVKTLAARLAALEAA
jgi:hypothetical protein